MVLDGGPKDSSSYPLMVWSPPEPYVVAEILHFKFLGII